LPLLDIPSAGPGPIVTDNTGIYPLLDTGVSLGGQEPNAGPGFHGYRDATALWNEPNREICSEPG